MILYICEKPSQAQDIARNLKATQRRDGYLEGNGYQITWCVGHLLSLAPPEYYKPEIKPWRIEKLPIIPDRWHMDISPKTKKQFLIIKNLLKTINQVVIATDADREGEMIAREVLDICHYKGKIERLWLSALDDASIQKALKKIKPGVETERLYSAGLGRQRADWLVGMNMTMGASALYGVNSVLSIGRVQTPTLKLVVDRDRIIENFKSQNYFTLKALFETEIQQSFFAVWEIPEKFLDKNGYCIEKNRVESIGAKIEDEPAIIQSFSESNKEQKAPLCFSLSSLQKKASSLFGFSAKQVLELAQSLYETHKATTYPRTDCGYLPEDQFNESSKVIEAILRADASLQSLVNLCDRSFKCSIWDNKKITAHHAIIPTINQEIDIGKMSSEEFKLYDLIRRQYLAQFLGNYKYLQKQVKIVCAGEIFNATGTAPQNQGWRQAFKHISEDELNEPEENVNIPLLVQNQNVVNKEIIVESKQTKPPAYFTEGTLIEAMKTVSKFIEDEDLKKILKENSGIGTEATRANILEVLFKRDYLQRKGKLVVSTDKGRALIDLVPDIVKNPALTARWEQCLDLVAEGKATLESFLASQTELLHTMLSQLQNEGSNKRSFILQLQSETKSGKVYLCPVCQSPLRRLKNKKGNYFWGCGQFPNCAFTTWEKESKPIL